MTNSVDLQNLIIEFYTISKECQRFCFAARARKYQEEAIEHLESFQVKIHDLKVKMISAQEEDYANQLLSMENMNSSLINELKMWVAFKDDDPHNAWEYIVEAQSSIRSAMQAHDIASHLDRYVERLYLLERVLFPPQTFMSTGMIIRRSTCSICGEEYGDCEHVKGRPYMGQLCVRNIEEFDLREISVVDEPANKHCRVLYVDDDEGRRDLLTWQLVPETATNPNDV